MSPMRRVFGNRAGPTALGILVPPGRSTVLILRPRALDWDLVLTHPPAEGMAFAPFRELNHHEAEAAAEQLCRALEEWVAAGPGQVEIVSLMEEQIHGVRVQVGGFPLCACRRCPGEAYQPARFKTLEDAQAAATALEAALGCPQEVYFNTRNFR